MTGLLDKLKGAVKELMGSASGNQRLKAEGKVDQAKGSAKTAAENLKERAKTAVGESSVKASERMKSVAERAEQATRRDPER
jgi:uncharacterized protein YjbJ (UPF0337 family)